MADQKSSRLKSRCSSVRLGTTGSATESFNAGGSKSSSSIKESVMTSVPANARLPFLGRDRQFKFLRVTHDSDRRGHSDFRCHQATLKLVNAGDRLILER